jgi:hypothetical protein
MRVVLTIAADYHDSMRTAFEEVAREVNSTGQVTGLKKDDVVDAIESADDFAIVDIELID